MGVTIQRRFIIRAAGVDYAVAVLECKRNSGCGAKRVCSLVQ